MLMPEKWGTRRAVGLYILDHANLFTNPFTKAVKILRKQSQFNAIGKKKKADNINHKLSRCSKLIFTN